MQNLNDFYAFKNTSQNGNFQGKNNNSNNNGNRGCALVLIIFAIIGWLLWGIEKIL